MRVDIISLFPELIQAFMGIGVTRRAYESGLVQVHCWNPRDFTDSNHRRVDDRPFGGGPGMVMMAEPLAACLQAIRAQRAQDRQTAPLVYFSPLGQVLSQAMVMQAATSAGAVLLCGRYEGVDQRFIDTHVDLQISLGDFVLSGGELAAMAWLDALARLQPGVLHDEESHLQDSFTPALSGLLDCPHYTRPDNWRGQGVPAPLLSGNHVQIAQWRRTQSLLLTAKLRPALIEQARGQGWLSELDEKNLKSAE
ncbi:MAG: tRNA (guanosine(37)-N1)-methyltransferase TrmD [Betaproteobacteria bacterium]|nr:tRNA (guanosine(37)-N1)-methyltransferase TrmD [Betaproteobacteria bacterium]